MPNRGVRIAIEIAASLAFAVGIYWALGRMLSAVAGLFDSHSETGQALSTLVIFLSPGYLGPLLVIALASSLFALFSYYREEDVAEDRPPGLARRAAGPRGGTAASGPANGSAHGGHGRRLERAAGENLMIAQEADPAAHPLART